MISAISFALHNVTQASNQSWILNIEISMFIVCLLMITLYSVLTCYFKSEISKTSYYDIFPCACVEENMFATVKKMAVLIYVRDGFSQKEERDRESQEKV